jgi:serine/threonine protein kinase
MIKKIENYVFNLGNKIGEGSFSQVFKGADIMTNRSVAVKKVRIGNIKSKISRRLLECEISILKIVNHKNIIKCLDVHSSINNCYIITELCDGGDLDSMLRIRTRFMEKDIAKILY